VTTVPEDPELGVSPDIAGGTAKTIPLLLAFPKLTVMGPVDAPAGTGTTMVLFVQLVGVAEVPLNCTMPPDELAPKLEPVMVTGVPGGPEVGEIVLMFGATVKTTALLAFPAAVTTTGPLVAPAGTGVTIDPYVMVLGVATTPLNVTTAVAESIGSPVKNRPRMSTTPPSGPLVGEISLMVGE
jgi:hypothetical protein